MKKIILVTCLIFFNIFLSPNNFAIANSIQEQVSDYCTKGDKILTYYENLEDKTDGLKYLKAAKYFYFQALRIDKASPNASIGVARIALLQNKTRDSKNILMRALNFNPENPRVSFYIAETFFQEGDYTEAIDYYNWAYNHGYKFNYKTNLQLAICYEKIYEINLAKKHYNEALKIKPDSELIKQRLQDMQKAQESIFEYKENKI